MNRSWGGVLALSWALTTGCWGEGKTWALVVGIDEYTRNSIPKLRYAVADAKLFARTLQETMKIPADQIYLMTSDTVDENAEPKAVNVAYQLSTLSKKVKAEDTVIFYFAGHGVTLEKEPFLLTEEADNRSPLTLKVSALHQVELVSAIRKLGASNTWLVFDACRNSPGAKDESGLSDEASRAVEGSVGSNRTGTMFACKVGERSWEWDEKKHGCFTYFLVEGMRKGGQDGRVTFSSICDEVERQVPVVTSKFSAVQHPWRLSAGSGDWLLALVDPGKVSRATPDLNNARLESLQAQLDKETALRVAAEQRARLEESKRMELEQRIALVEKQLQLGGQGVAASPPSTANMVAYLDRGIDDNKRSQALEAEVKRLQEENRTLKNKLSMVEDQAPKLGLASREVALGSSSEWKAASQEEDRLWGQLANPATTAEEKLRLNQELRQTMAGRLSAFESAYQKGIESLSQSEENRKAIESQKTRVTICRAMTTSTRARVAAAQAAVGEAQQRYEALQRTLALLEQDVVRTTQQIEKLKNEIRGLESELSALQSRKAELIQQMRLADEELQQWLEKDKKRADSLNDRNPYNDRGMRRLYDLLQIPGQDEARGFGEPQRP